MYLYMYVYVYVPREDAGMPIILFVHVYVCVRMYACIHVRMYTGRTCRVVGLATNLPARLNQDTHPGDAHHARTHTHKYTHTHTHTITHSHTPTYTHTPFQTSTHTPTQMYAHSHPPTTSHTHTPTPPHTSSRNLQRSQD
jgi:hypothetical protein